MPPFHGWMGKERSRAEKGKTALLAHFKTKIVFQERPGKNCSPLVVSGFPLLHVSSVIIFMVGIRNPRASAWYSINWTYFWLFFLPAMHTGEENTQTENLISSLTHLFFQNTFLLLTCPRYGCWMFLRRSLGMVGWWRETRRVVIFRLCIVQDVFTPV